MLLENSEYPYTDESEKIYEIQNGWVSGTGVGELIRSIANNFEDNIEKKRYEEIAKLSNKYLLEKLLETLIIYSVSDKKQHKMYYMGNANGMIEAYKDILIAMQPIDIQEVKWNDIYNNYFEKLQTNAMDINDDIKYIAEAIYNVSKNCQSVSEICDIGVLKSDGEKIRIREECKKLINETINMI